MSKYSCESCKFNNNGWCKINQFNGLKKRNIQECKDFRKDGINFTIKRYGKDFYGQEFILIKINDEVVELPVNIIKEFIEDKTMNSREINIPKEQ